MRYQSELERLTTLDAATIRLACSSSGSLPGLIADAVDRCIAFDDRADEESAAGHDDEASLCRQEASAWRATAATLRAMGADAHTAGHEAGAA